MSKTEFVKALNDSEPQLQIIKTMRLLQQTTQQMREDLQVLPEAIAQEVAPLIQLEQRVEDICEAQRAAITALVEEISGQTRDQLNGAANLISRAADQVSNSAQTLECIVKATNQAEVMEAKITSLSKQLDSLTPQIALLTDKIDILMKSHRINSQG